MADVFISYSRADRNRVRLIAHGLTAEGFAVWWDPDIRPGKKWNDAIRKALEGSAAIVTVWSKHSTKSDWVLAETTHANARGALVPVLLETCSPPIPFNMVQAADLRKWKGDADDPEWTPVLTQVRALVEKKRKLVPAAPPPGEAYGQTGGGPSMEPGTYRPSRMRPKARSPWAMGAIGAAVIATVAVVFGQGVISELTHRNEPRDVAPAPFEAPVSSEYPPLPEPPVAATPVEEAAPVPPPVEAPASADPAVQPLPVDDSGGVKVLDACAGQLALKCPGGRGQAPRGFDQDGKLSTAEAGFLGRLGVTGKSNESAQSCTIRLEAAQARAQASPNSVVGQACQGLEWPTTQTAPPVQTNPTPPTAPTQPLANLDACVAGLPSLCPAPRPSVGFALDGKISTQETSLMSSADPNFSVTNPNAAQRCQDVTGKLRGLSAERLKASAFGQTCVRLGSVKVLSPAILKNSQIQLQKAQPEPAIR